MRLVLSAPAILILPCTLALCSGCSDEGGGSQDSGATETEGDTTGDTTGTGDGTGTGTTGGMLDPVTLELMTEVIFYDGYAETVDEPVPEGIVRHSNSLLATKLTDEHLASIQSHLMIGVINGALCDNYDRIGNVNLALVPKGADDYVPAEVDRIELARFITPFMDMNKEPGTVPYEWEADNVVPILKDPDLLAAYDFWMELSIFGVPYAANTEVAGCDGRNDTQRGWLLLYTDSTREPEQFNELLPIAISEAFNNHQDGASDELGTTKKTRQFELAADSDNAQLVLITSNHGANQGGEEYIRREHYVYVDGELVLQYKPGRETCEPFRKYNTQGNGIYGPSAKTPEEWQSFSNWCPGDVIDTRIVELGPVGAGSHEFVIDVPDATFFEMQGNFPFSLYVQAK